MVQRRARGSPSAREMAGVVIMHRALVTTPGMSIRGMAMPVIRPNWAVAAVALKPE